MATDSSPSKPRPAVPKAKPAPAQRAMPVAQPAGQQAMQAQAQQAQSAPDDDDGDEDGAQPRGRFILFNAVPSWLVSLVFHKILLIVLALAAMPQISQELERVEELVPAQTRDLYNAAYETDRIERANASSDNLRIDVFRVKAEVNVANRADILDNLEEVEHQETMLMSFQIV